MLVPQGHCTMWHSLPQCGWKHGLLALSGEDGIIREGDNKRWVSFHMAQNRAFPAVSRFPIPRS